MNSGKLLQNLAKVASFFLRIGSTSVYTLYGVSNHMGGTHGGHYTAFCKHPDSMKWHCYNDSRYFLKFLLLFVIRILDGSMCQRIVILTACRNYLRCKELQSWFYGILVFAKIFSWNYCFQESYCSWLIRLKKDMISRERLHKGSQQKCIFRTLTLVSSFIVVVCLVC